MSKAIEDVIAERKRQVEIEGWTAAHDDTHNLGEMANAAASYALTPARRKGLIERIWPWDSKWWKPANRRRDLVKAGALIIAEIERLDREAK